jgi:hypothetical protein
LILLLNLFMNNSSIQPKSPIVEQHFVVSSQLFSVLHPKL